LEQRAESAARAEFVRAATFLQDGHHAKAESAFVNVLRLLPSHANSWRNLGLIVHARGDVLRGLRCVIRALVLDPAIADAPELPLARLFGDAHNAAQLTGAPLMAKSIARDWLHWCPHNRGAIGAVAMAALAAGTLDLAEEHLSRLADDRALTTDPTLCHARALLALGRGQPETATSAARAAVIAAPSYADAWATLGIVALRYRDGEGAAPALARTLHMAPGHIGAQMALASLRLSEGDAVSAARTVLSVPAAVRRAPAHLGDLLSILHHAPGIAPDLIAAERAGALPRTGGWQPPDALHSALPCPAPLRIVYLGDLSRPQIAALALPAIRAHARPAAKGLIESHLIHATPPDLPPAPAPDLSDGPPIHTVAPPTAEALQQQIRTLAPHVLVLLTPTTLPQSLEALAERLAPVQAIWGDVFGSVGVPGLDVLLTDAQHISDPALISERPVFLPHGAYFFDPPAAAPDPGPPPCLSRGHMTFGSFNRLDKLNDPLLARWGELLAALPEAHLVVQARALDRAATRAALRTRLAHACVDPTRIHLEGGRDRAGMMELFRTVDIALDSDPWSGGLTVLELLWMGVPTITLAGAHPNGRHAVSHLTRTGLPDWITQTPKDYVARAVAADRAKEALAPLRAALRARLAALPLCDPVAYAAQLEAAYRDLWDDHRNGVPPGSGTRAL